MFLIYWFAGLFLASVTALVASVIMRTFCLPPTVAVAEKLGWVLFALLLWLLVVCLTYPPFYTDLTWLCVLFSTLLGLAWVTIRLRASYCERYHIGKAQAFGVAVTKITFLLIFGYFVMEMMRGTLFFDQPVFWIGYLFALFLNFLAFESALSTP
ncbi:MAG: hypothetical protein H7Y38_06120 [Armatimonadetes bacterium]|nr:hypothetical protein [Armatimonadota bacterium]